jgi:plastocyanin
VTKALAIGAATVSLAACGATSASSTTSNSSSASTKNEATIVINNFKYYPATLVVSPGETVVVKNKDVATHSVTAQPGPNGQAPAFNSGNIAPGAQGTFKAPTTKGTYPYICDIHSFMHGTLIVK